MRTFLFYFSGKRGLFFNFSLLVLQLILTLSPAGARPGISVKLPAGNYTIRSMVQDSTGHIWIGTFGSGLWRISAQGFSPRRIYCEKSGQPFSMISNLRIHQNHLWIATAGGGCVCMNLETGNFSEINQINGFDKLHALHINRSGDILIGAVGSGTAILRKTGKKAIWQPVAKRLYTHVSWVNHIDEWQEKLWIGTNTGLYSTDHRQVVKNWSPETAGLFEGVNHFFPADGQMYISTTSAGLYVMKPGKQPGPVMGTFGETHFSCAYDDNVIAGGRYGLWKIENGEGIEIKSFPKVVAKTFLITQKNTRKSLLIGTLDGKIYKTTDLKKFKLFTNLREHNPEETD